MRPLIGITTRNLQRGDGIPPLTGSPQPYIDSIIAAGGVPILLPISDDLQHAIDITSICQGIVLTGGEDVDPSFYREQNHPKLEYVDVRRDAFEFAVIRAAREKELPILAICRGAQVLNVADGGTLYQDLASQVEGALPHASGGDIAGRVAAETHDVTIVPDSQLHEILGSTSIKTNSLHHQSVKELAPGFTVTARSEDGVIEAFESDEVPFCVAVQFHPETMWQKTNTQFLKLFEAFVESTKQ